MEQTKTAEQVLLEHIGRDTMPIKRVNILRAMEAYANQYRNPNPDIIEPLLIKAGDNRILINGEPPRVDCRIVAEDNYQILLNQKGE